MQDIPRLVNSLYSSDLEGFLSIVGFYIENPTQLNVIIYIFMHALN